MSIRKKGFTLGVAILFMAGAFLYLAGSERVWAGDGPGVELTREIVNSYFNPADPEHIHDLTYVADDVVFLDMASGQALATSREELSQLLDWFWRVAFDAHPAGVQMVIGNGRAVAEWTVEGTHIGEFAGVPATGKQISFPKIVSYELEGNWPYRIKTARVYMMTGILMEQISQ